MAIRGKSVNLFLMDGEPSGRTKCTMSNWTGIAYKIPRTALDKCKDMDILKQSGVYFLFWYRQRRQSCGLYWSSGHSKKRKGSSASRSGNTLRYRILDRGRHVYDDE